MHYDRLSRIKEYCILELITGYTIGPTMSILIKMIFSSDLISTVIILPNAQNDKTPILAGSRRGHQSIQYEALDYIKYMNALNQIYQIAFRITIP